MTKIKYKPYILNPAPPALTVTSVVSPKRISPYFLLPSKNPSGYNRPSVDPMTPPVRLSVAEPLYCKLGTAENDTHVDASLSLPLAKPK